MGALYAVLTMGALYTVLTMGALYAVLTMGGLYAVFAALVRIDASHGSWNRTQHSKMHKNKSTTTARKGKGKGGKGAGYERKYTVHTNCTNAP